jgi:hypothetical protein
VQGRGEERRVDGGYFHRKRQRVILVKMVREKER